MAINKKRLQGAAESTAIVPSENFSTVLYTGTGASQNIQVGFAPDFVWLKKRNTSKDWQVVDTVRDGVTGSTGANILYTTLTQGQDTGVGKAYFSNFNSDGFTLGGNDYFNGDDQTYVAYCWGAPDTFSHSANGSQLASTGKSNQAAGFSIVSYTGNNSSGATVKHNLDATPEMIWVKRTDTSGDWDVFTAATGKQKYLILDTGQSVLTDSSSNIWNNADPTNSVFTIGNHASVNANNGTYISYCFASKADYSKVGTYTGNGAVKHIDCGFEPAFLFAKSVTQELHWVIYDNKRNTSNSRDCELYPNAANAEDCDSRGVDFTTTGFQLNSSSYLNTDTKDYIFYALAADPDTTTPTVAKSFNIDTWTGNGAVQQIGSVNTLFTKYGIFNGSSSKIDLPNFMPSGNASRSVSMWIRTTQTTAATLFKYGGANTNLLFNFRINDGGTNGGANTIGIGFYANDFNRPATTLMNGKWHHVVATHNGSVSEIYIDGVQTGADENTGTVNTTASAALIGSDDDEFLFNGSIDQVRVYNTAINQVAITSLYNETQASASTLNYPAGLGCLALYEFNDDADDTGNNYDGTAANVTYDSFLFKPDLVIIKNIVAAINNQNWYWADTLRGEHMQLRSDGSGSDNDDRPYGVTSFNDAGFSVSDIAAGNNNVNGAVGGTYSKAAQFIAYSFKMLDNNNNVPIENTVGTIDSLTSVNAAAGMSIAKYTGNGTEGATIGHGLNSIPNLVIIKCLSAGEAWFVAHSSLAANNFLELQSTAAATNIAALHYERLATTFKTTGSNPHDMINVSGKRYIMYSFITTSSFSKFGSYEGNQNTGVNNQVDFGANMSGVDFVMIKNADAANSQWMLFDSERTNGMAFYMNTTAPESNYIGDLTISSQGLRFGSTNINVNRANETYIYWAMKIN